MKLPSPQRILIVTARSRNTKLHQKRVLDPHVTVNSLEGFGSVFQSYQLGNVRKEVCSLLHPGL